MALMLPPGQVRLCHAPERDTCRDHHPRSRDQIGVTRLSWSFERKDVLSPIPTLAAGVGSERR